MSTKENRSIAYIYNEMDPSEKLEFERDLQRDNNLLIEVESLRKVSNNLNRLEHMEPPSHVVDAVCESAKIHANGRNRSNSWKTFFYSAAAVLLVGLTSGIFMMEDPTADNDGAPAESATVSPASPAIPMFSQPVSSSSVGSLAPWVDKNEIIYFQGRTGSDNQAFIDSIRNDSYKKLTPVTDPTLTGPYERELHLTGSRN